MAGALAHGPAGGNAAAPRWAALSR